jgi:integrase
MGRKPTKPGAIPRFRARKQKSGVTFYYYDHGIGADGKRCEEPLGRDYGLAIKRWAEIEHESSPPLPATLVFRYIADAYRRDVVPTKGLATQKDNVREIGKLIEFFDDPPAPLEAIQPVNVRQYMTWRTKDGGGRVRANREKALLSHIWNYARDRGYTALPNPCAGIKGFRETGRDVYVENAQFDKIYAQADHGLRDLMDLLYLTGQRPADVVALDETAIRDGAMHFRQGKTGTKVRIEVTGALAAVVDRIRARKRQFAVYTTAMVVTADGKVIREAQWSRRFAAACATAKMQGIQLRDLRAKAATDKAESAGDIRQAQRQLGHTTISMTEHYTRKRRGEKVTPTK